MTIDAGPRPAARGGAAFEERSGGSPALGARTPGRVNLIGEHTDCNDGSVLPMAIDRAVWIALRPRTDSRGRDPLAGRTEGLMMGEACIRSAAVRQADVGMC